MSENREMKKGGGEQSLSYILTKIANGTRRIYGLTSLLTLSQIADLLDPNAVTFISRGTINFTQGSYVSSEGNLGGGWWTTKGTTIANFNQLLTLNKSNNLKLIWHLYVDKDYLCPWGFRDAANNNFSLKANTDNKLSVDVPLGSLTTANNLYFTIGLFNGGLNIDRSRTYAEAYIS